MSNCIVCNGKFTAYNSRNITCFKKCSKLRKLQKCAEYREQNKEHRVNVCKEYYIKNKDKIAECKKNYEFNRRNSDINHKLKCNLRKRLSVALVNSQKTGSAIENLGCSIEDLKKHLESQFQEGMSWDNYGLYGWHIDHIKPLSSYDLTDRNELKKLVIIQIYNLCGLKII